MTDSTNDKRIFVGSSIRAYDDGRVEGYLVPFTTQEQRDYYGTYFDKATDYGLAYFPVTGAPTLYQHGLDDTLQVRGVGKVTSLRIDDVGLWIEAQLTLKDEYDQAVLSLARKGALSWSSGALPQSVDQAEDGHINRWYIIEASLTPTPATPSGRTQISTTRAIGELPSFAELMETSAKEGDGTNASVSELPIVNEVNADEPAQGDVTMTRDEVKALFMDLLTEMGLVPASVDAAEIETAMMADVEGLAVDELTEELRSAMITKAARAIQASADKRKAVIKSAADAARRAAARPEDGVSFAQAAGTRSAGERKAGNVTTNFGVNVGEENRFAHLSTSALRMMALMKFQGGNGQPSPALLRTLAGRTEKEYSTNYENDYAAHNAMRTIKPWRADEIDASNIVGFGQEWVAVGYGTDIWKTARETLIWQTLQAKGMETKEIMPGTNSTFFATEGSDPIAYSTPEANDVDTTGRPEMVYNISPFSTGRVEATAAPVRFATAYTVQLEEDSLVEVASQVDYQMRMVAAETIEKLLINGDTVTTASTNINNIDGTPGTGLARPYYLAINGMRKLPLVTNTARSVDAANILNPTTFLNLLSLLPSKLTSDPSQLAFIMTNGTRLQTLGLVQLLTDSERGAFATFTTGKIPTLWGVDALTSGFMLASNTAGKVAVTTPANNTRGSILLVYPRYWGLGFKRAFNLEVERFPGSETNVYYGSMRMSLVSRSTDAAAIAYNVPMMGS